MKIKTFMFVSINMNVSYTGNIKKPPNKIIWRLKSGIQDTILTWNNALFI